MLEAAASATATAGQPPVERRRRLSPAALAVTSQKVHPAYSPIVIAGAARLIDFFVLSLILACSETIPSPPHKTSDSHQDPDQPASHK